MFITIIFPPDASGLLMDQRLPAIAKVPPESPPEKAGRFPDDPFVAIEGKEVSKGRDRHHALEQKGWGNNITFTVTRGKKQKIAVELHRSENEQAAQKCLPPRAGQGPCEPFTCRSGRQS